MSKEKDHKADILLLDEVRLTKTLTLTLHDESVSQNFQIINQSLRKIFHAINDLALIRQSSYAAKNQLAELEGKVNFQGDRIFSIAKDITHEGNVNHQQNEYLDFVKSDDFLRNVYRRIDEVDKKCDIAIAKSKDQDVTDIINKLIKSDKFVSADKFTSYQADQLQRFEQVNQTMQDKVDGRDFRGYKYEMGDQLILFKEKLGKLVEHEDQHNERILQLSQNCKAIQNQLNQNNGLMKEMDSQGGDSKLKLLKQEMTREISSLTAKIRKRSTFSDLSKMEGQIVGKLDNYFGEFMDSVAFKSELKDGLQIVDEQLKSLCQPKSEKEPEKEGLFAARSIWQCAACATSLGKYEGKLDRYRPWSIFPTRGASPSKLGGFGYLGHIEKMIKKDGPDQSLQKYEQKKLSPQSVRAKCTDIELAQPPMGFKEFYEREAEGSSKQSSFKQRAAKEMRTTAHSFRVTRRGHKEN